MKMRYDLLVTIFQKTNYLKIVLCLALCFNHTYGSGLEDPASPAPKYDFGFQKYDGFVSPINSQTEKYVQVSLNLITSKGHQIALNAFFLVKQDGLASVVVRGGESAIRWEAAGVFAFLCQERDAFEKDLGDLPKEAKETGLKKYQELKEAACNRVLVYNIEQAPKIQFNPEGPHIQEPPKDHKHYYDGLSDDEKKRITQEAYVIYEGKVINDESDCIILITYGGEGDTMTLIDMAVVKNKDVKGLKEQEAIQRAINYDNSLPNPPLFSQTTNLTSESSSASSSCWSAFMYVITFRWLLDFLKLLWSGITWLWNDFYDNMP